MFGNGQRARRSRHGTTCGMGAAGRRRHVAAARPAGAGHPPGGGPRDSRDCQPSASLTGGCLIPLSRCRVRRAGAPSRAPAFDGSTVRRETPPCSNTSRCSPSSATLWSLRGCCSVDPGDGGRAPVRRARSLAVSRTTLASLRQRGAPDCVATSAALVREDLHVTSTHSASRLPHPTACSCDLVRSKATGRSR